MDLNKEPERHSFSCGIDLNDEPQGHSFSCGIDLNDELERHYPFQMNGIPGIFHDYIDSIHDVEADENCGFRAVTVCLGYNEDQWLYIRKQLLEELESQYYAYHRVFTDGGIPIIMLVSVTCTFPVTLVTYAFDWLLDCQ